jgi:hypothetical protein
MRLARLAVAVGLVLGTLTLGLQAGPQDDAKSAKKDAGKKAEPPKLGLQVNDPRALQGYTLLSPIMSKKAYLIDMQGRVVRTWTSESSGSLSCYLLENGHVLRHAKVDQQAFGDGPGAGGHIQEFTWEGDLVWDFKLANAHQLAHHDICRMPNGNVLVTIWEKKSAEEAIAAGRRPETVKGNMLPEGILEIKPTGKTTGEIVWEWHVWDHLVQDQDSSKANFGDVGAHPELVDVNFGEGVLASIVAKKEELEKLKAIGYIGSTSSTHKPAPARADWLHLNAISYHPELDQILVSSPEFNEIWIIDHSTTTAEAAGHKGGRYGKGGDLLYRWGNPRAYRAGNVKDQKLFYQHNAHWIPKGYPGAGHLLIFNNGQRRPGGAYSSVDEIALPVLPDGRYEHKPGTAYGPDKPIWSYSAPKRSEFYAQFISGADRLPNGNTIICSGPNGMIFEVTPEREIVWKYLNPIKNEMTPPPPPPPVEVLPAFVRDGLKLTEPQTKKLEDLAKDTESKLLAVLNEDQKKQLREPPKGPPMMRPPGPPPAMQVVELLPGPVRSRLKLTDEQKKQLDTLKKETETKLEETLTADQKKQLKEVRERFVNAWGGGPGGGGPPPLGNALFRSYRYAANYPGLAGKHLTPGKTIEELQGQGSEKK